MDLINWLQSHKAKVDGVDLHDFPETGRGLRATKSFKRGEVILQIPESVLWTEEKAKSHPVLGRVFTKHTLRQEDVFAIWLIYEKNISRKNSFYHHHIELLPKTYTNTLFWTEEDLEYLKGSNLYIESKHLRTQQTISDYNELVTLLSTELKSEFPITEFSLQDYQWALTTLWSRGMDFHMRCIVPLADMANASLELLDTPCHRYNQTNNCVELIAGKDYASGEQVFIHYGAVSNSKLLRLYGFSIMSNPYNNVQLYVGSLGDDMMKRRVCNLFGVDPDKSVYELCARDPIPEALLMRLRIQFCSSNADLTKLLLLGSGGGNKMAQISPENEAIVNSVLRQALEGMLCGYGEDRSLAEDISIHAKQALELVRDEKAILKLALKQVQ